MKATEKKFRVVIAGGGTGGHLFPGLAIAEEIEKRWPAEIVFIGTDYGIESKVLPGTHYRLKKIWMRGLRRKITPGNLLFPLRLMISLVQCALFFLLFRPDVIIGTGGYVSGPALMAGLTLGIHTVIQEQNSYPGLVNRLLGKWVDQVHITYADSRPYFAKQPHVYLSGNPLRQNLKGVEKAQALKLFNLKSNQITLLVFGGSQGAHAINLAILECLDNLMKIPELQILWSTGQNDFELIKSKCRNFADRIRVFPFIENMAAAYAVADFVVSRAGAMTLAEITYCGLPAILIPYPFAAEGHQEFNARTLEKAGAARVILEKNLNGRVLCEAIQKLARDHQTRRAMAEASQRLARPDAARCIVNGIARLINVQSSAHFL